MRLFTSPYVLLALAGSSALAVPLSASQRDCGTDNASTQTLSSPPRLMGRQPIGLGVGPEVTSVQAVDASPNNAVDSSPYNAVEHTSNKVYYDNGNIYDPKWQQEESQYVEGRRRSNGESDISERGAAKKITKDDLFRHFFRQAVTGKGKKRSPSVAFNREVS